MRNRLRFDLGAVYDVELDYDRISPDLAHVVFGTEADERETGRVQQTMLEIIDEVAEHGPTTEELAAEVTGLRRDWEHEDARLGYVLETAFDTLLGRPFIDPEPFAAERAAVTPEVAREIAGSLGAALMSFGPGENPAPDRLTELPEWSPREVAGDVIASAGRHLPGRGPKERLIVGSEGVTLRLSPTERVTVLYRDLLASVHEGDTRRLHGNDGGRVVIDAAWWRDRASSWNASTPPRPRTRSPAAAMRTAGWPIRKAGPER